MFKALVKTLNFPFCLKKKAAWIQTDPDPVKFTDELLPTLFATHSNVFPFTFCAWFSSTYQITKHSTSAV